MSSSAVWDKLQGLYEEAIDKSFAGAVDEVPSMFPSSFGKANGAKAAKLTSESLARAKALAMVRRARETRLHRFRARR